MKRQKTETMSLTSKEPIDVFTHAQPLSFFLTKVYGISSDYNGAYTMSLRGIFRQAIRKKIWISLKYRKFMFMKNENFNWNHFFDIADILSESMGNLQESCQVNSQYNINFASSASHITQVFCWHFPLHRIIFVSSNCSLLENSVVWRPKPINF